jgi:hypothetical protein
MVLTKEEQRRLAYWKQQLPEYEDDEKMLASEALKMVKHESMTDAAGSIQTIAWCIDGNAELLEEVEGFLLELRSKLIEKHDEIAETEGTERFKESWAPLDKNIGLDS